jgi:hypothetical protein
MINFIPVAFAGDENTCPVCVARLNLESVLAEIESELTQSQPYEGPDKLLAYSSLIRLFAAMHCDYRVSCAVNLSIWFAAERYGRVKKVPELIIAYDEYRERFFASFSAFEETSREHAELLASATLIAALEKLPLVARLYFEEVDKWTVKRREDAFTII